MPHVCAFMKEKECEDKVKKNLISCSLEMIQVCCGCNSSQLQAGIFSDINCFFPVFMIGHDLAKFVPVKKL